MKGFKDTTKTIQGHHSWSGQRNPGYATGGVVVPYKAPDRTAPMMRPVLPRPHVMPNMPKVSMPRRMARGGQVMQGKSDGGGGPYNPPGGNSLSKANRPYSQIEVEHSRSDARPGYARGGKRKARPKTARNKAK